MGLSTLTAIGLSSMVLSVAACLPDTPTDQQDAVAEAGGAGGHSGTAHAGTTASKGGQSNGETTSGRGGAGGARSTTSAGASSGRGGGAAKDADAGKAAAPAGTTNNGTPQGGSTGEGGSTGSTDATGGAGGVAGARSSNGGAGRTAGSAGSVSASAGGSGMHAMPDAGPQGAGATAHGMGNHCTDGFAPDPRDATITSKPDEWKASNGDIDLVVPKGVLDWMGERVWEQSHDAWHNIRRCKAGTAPGGTGGGAGAGAGGVNVCAHTDLVPQHQECTDAEDGYEFLVMHRHMMQALRQAFPQHADLFNGFPRFPYDAQNVPSQWQGRFGTGWSQEIKSVADVLENIEKNLSRFATEGDLGKYIQCGSGTNGASSIHGALHFKWVVNESPHSLGKQPVNIDNYMFWKLHGWIDQIWERYRVAKGVASDEPKLKDALIDQCRQMHDLGMLFDPTLAKQPDAPLPEEHGYFHEKVRPILEKTCSGCHAETSPQANLALGGHISSADIVKGLVSVSSMFGGQFKRVVPRAPDQSWFYLKPAGLAATAGCNGASCNAEVMPPTGEITLSDADLQTIRQWIQDGAPAPTN